LHRSKKIFFSFFYLLAAATLLFVAHYFWFWPTLQPKIPLGPFLKKSYMFLTLLNGIGLAVAQLAHIYFAQTGGFAFLGFSLLKMAASVAFLWQPLQLGLVPQNQLILNFMAPYLLFLVVEIRAVQPLLKTEDTK
jgi:hypothetical protein